MTDSTRGRVRGTAVAVRGADIDTDRIIPARFLVSITFDGLGANAFADDRAEQTARRAVHPFDDERFRNAKILLVNRNFGCGSSREHAPQALNRRGIQAIVGESFAEIFFGNCVTIGLPCVTAAPGEIGMLMDACERDAGIEFTIDVEGRRVTGGGMTVDVGLPEGPRRRLIDGSWDSTAELLRARDDIARVARNLPYSNRFR